MSKLKQQNIELSSSLTIVDWPQMPTQAVKSKRKLLIIAAFLAGFFGTLAVLVTGQLLNQSLSTPANAEKVTGLKLIGAIPSLNHPWVIKYPQILKQLLNAITSKLYQQGEQPKIIAVGSVQNNEGKKTIIKLLADHFERTGITYKVITPKINDLPVENTQEYNYQDDLQKYKRRDIDFLIILLPEYAEGIVPIKILEQTDSLIFVARADRSWSMAQQKMRKEFQCLTRSKPLLLLNGVKPHHLDQLIGELPTSRISMMHWIRRVMKLEILGNTIK